MSIPGAKVIDHGQAFPTLSEKAEYFGIPLERITKTIYFEDGENVVAAVLPMTGRVDTKRLASELGLNRLRLAREESLPRGQYPGSLGPWIIAEDRERIAKVVFNVGDYGITDWAYPGDPGKSVHADYLAMLRTLSSANSDKYASARISESTYPDRSGPLSRAY